MTGCLIDRGTCSCFALGFPPTGGIVVLHDAGKMLYLQRGYGK
jgi:hypothetical protein